MTEDCPENDIVELIIPTCIEKSSNCLHLASNRDITHQYKIKLRNVCNQRLYIERETDLRDVLRQYCMYKKLSELINKEMSKLNLEFQITDVCESNQNQSQVEGYRDTAFRLIQTSANPYCGSDCGRMMFVRPGPLDPVTTEEPLVSSYTVVVQENAEAEVEAKAEAKVEAKAEAKVEAKAEAAKVEQTSVSDIVSSASLESDVKRENTVKDSRTNQNKKCCVVM